MVDELFTRLGFDVRALLSGVESADRAFAELEQRGAKLTQVLREFNKEEELTRIVLKAVGKEGEKLSITLGKLAKKTAEFSRQEIITAAATRQTTEELQRQRMAAFAASVARKKQQQGVDAAIFKTMKADEKANKAMQDNAKNTNKAVQSVLISWKSLGRLILIQIVRQAIFELIRALRQSVEEAAEFSRRVAEVRTISQQAQLSTEKWSQGLRELSDSFGLDILDQTEAAYQSLSNQVVKGAETFEFLAEANKFAIATASDTSSAVNLLTAAINAFGFEAEDAEELSAKFFKTIELGRLRASDLSSSFGNVAVIANKLNITFEELNAALAVLTIQGLKPSVAMTQLRGIFIKLLKPTEEMKQLFRDIGVESGEAAIQTFGFAKFMEIVEKRTQGSSTEVAKLFSRLRGLTAALTFSGKGLERFERELGKIENASESFGKATNIVLDSVGKRFEIQINRIRNFFIKDVGITLVRGIVTLGDAFEGLEVLIKSFAITAVEVLSLALVLLASRALFALKALKALALANPFTLMLIAATATLQVINTIAVRAQKIRDDAIKAQIQSQKDVIKATKKRIKDEVNLIKDAIDEEIKLRDLGQSEIFKIINKSNDRIRESNKKLLESIEDDQKAITKGLTSQIKNTEKEIKRLEDIAKNTAKNIREALREGSRILFEFDVEELDVENKIRRITDRITFLQKESVKALKDINEEEFDRIRKRIIELALERRSIERKALDENKQNAQKRIDLIRDEEIATFDFLKEERQLLKEIKATRDTKDRAKVQEELNRLTGKTRNIIFDIRNELINIRDTDIDLIDSRRQIVLFTRQEIVGRQVLAKLAKEQSDLVKARLVDEILIETNLREAAKAVANFKLQEALELKTAKEVNKAITDRERAVNRLIEANRDAQGTDEQRQKLALLLANDRLVLEQRLIKLRLVTGQKEEITARDNLLVQLKTLKNIVAEEERRVNLTKSRAKESLKLLRAGPGLVAGLRFERTPGEVAAQARETSEIFIATADALERFNADQTALNFRLLQKNITALIPRFQEAKNIFANVRAESQAFQDSIRNLAADFIGLGREGKSFDEQISQVAEGEKEIIRIQDALKKSFADIEKVQKTSTEQNNKSTRSLSAFEIQTRNTVSAMNILTEAIKRRNAALQQARLSDVPVQGFAQGGFVSHGTDTIPAMLSPGEFVVNARNTRKFFSQLTAMNAGRQPQGFAQGGPVTVGDINVSLSSTGKETVDVARLGRLLRREIKRGRVKLT